MCVIRWLWRLLVPVCPRCGARTRAYTVVRPVPVSSLHVGPDTRPVRRHICDGCGWRGL